MNWTLKQRRGFDRGVAFFAALFLGPLLLVSFVALVVQKIDWPDYALVRTFDCGEGREVHIHQDWFVDLNTPLYFSVAVDGEVVQPVTAVHMFSNELVREELSLRSGLGGRIVAIEYEGHTAAVYDFDSRASWVCGDGLVDLPQELADALASNGVSP